MKKAIFFLILFGFLFGLPIFTSFYVYQARAQLIEPQNTPEKTATANAINPNTGPPQNSPPTPQNSPPTPQIPPNVGNSDSPLLPNTASPPQSGQVNQTVIYPNVPQNTSGVDPSLDPAVGTPNSGTDVSPPGDESQTHQEAYERSLRELLPVTPEEIQVFRERVDQRDKALADSPPGSLSTRTVRFNLEPGFVPPMVVLTPNLVTALVFMDSTGTPWPVTSSVLGNGSLFKVDILKDDNLNRVIISPLTAHGNSNLVITLKDHGIPLIIRLETRSGVDAQRKVDGLIIYQVQERGPLATPRLSREELPTPVNDLLYLILDGIIPESGIKLESAPKVDETTFLKLGDALFVRTRQTLLWPAYRARASGAGGYAVYETVYLSSIIMGIEDEIQRVNLSLPEGAS